MSVGAGPSKLRSPSLAMLEHAELIKQGAEARVYSLPSLYPSPTLFSSSSSSPNSSSSSSSAGPPVILKYRFPKTYRHPTLDASLTKSRISFEARALARCLKAGICVPKVVFVDEKSGVLALERVEGWSVREILGGGAEGEVEDDGEGDYVEPNEAKAVVEELEGVKSEGLEALERIGVTKQDLMGSIGTILARLHSTTIIHGDLTTSNMMLRLTPNSLSGHPYEIVLIDFGLSSTAQYAENYAVDLYVLERAFASTHPASEGLHAGVLEAYAKGLGEKKWKPIETKLKEVRLRGRKRDMTG